MRTPLVETEASKDLLAERIAARVNEVLVEAQQRRGRAALVLTGGSMGIAAVQALAASTRTAEFVPDWRNVDLWWSDERFVPEGDAERNVQQAAEASEHFALLTDLPPENVHVMGDSDSFATPEEAAQDYLAELRTAAAAQDADGPFPPFDVALLGMGPDGHVASVFPGRSEVHIQEPTVVAVHDSPKPPPTRISMTLPLISTAQHVWYVVSGAEKADAVRRLLHSAPVDEIPALGASGTVSTVLFATPDALPAE